MAIFSLLLSFAAVFFALLGFVSSFVPGLGAVFSFAAPGLALVGIIVGSTAMSKARQEGRPRDLSVIAVVLNVLAFFPSVMVAMTCGMCNAMLSGGSHSVQRSFQVRMGIPAEPDGGAAEPAPSPLDPPPLNPQPADSPGLAADPADPAEIPPPPLPAGPVP